MQPSNVETKLTLTQDFQIAIDQMEICCEYMQRIEENGNSNPFEGSDIELGPTSTVSPPPNISRRNALQIFVFLRGNFLFMIGQRGCKWEPNFRP